MSKFSGESKKVKCHKCGREVIAVRDSNGIGESTGPLRIILHSGGQYGRFCSGSDELVETKE